MKATVEKGELVLRIPIDTPDKAPLSSSGKSKVLASTRGNMALDLKVGNKTFPVKIGLNVYTPV